MALQFTELIKSMRTEWDNGAEDENNWKRRNDYLRRLADLCESGKYDPPRDLYEHLKPFFNHLTFTCATERTTLGISALACLGAIFKVLGSQMAPQLDHMLPQLITLCGVTKKLTSKSAGSAMETICATVGYNPRLIVHVCEAFKEKATSSRLYAAGWLNHIFSAYNKYLDPVKDFPRIDTALISGLQDSQNAVREALRPTYWRYAKIQGNNAAAVMDKLAKDKANALKNHPDNPDKSNDTSRPPRPVSALSQIKAQRKANLKQTTSVKPTVSAVPVEASVPLPASPEEPKEIISSNPESRGNLRTLMAAPVRRPRIVATPMSQSQPPVRPSSKDDSKKLPVATGRQTPTLQSGRETPTEELPIRGHKKQASSRSGRQTPTIREDNSHQKKPSVSRAKTAPVPVVTSRPTSSSSSKTPLQRAPSDSISNTEAQTVYTTTTQSSGAGSASLFEAPSTQTPATLPSEIVPLRSETANKAPVQHVLDGKENAFVYNDGCTHKKAYEACKAKSANSRSEVVRLKDALRSGKLDALGHKKLSGMLKDKPGQLVTSQKDFDDLYTVLVNALSNNATVSAPQGNSVKNPGHPFYNRHALIDSIMRLLEQFPDAGEPQPGMALAAVIKCRASHPDGERFRTAATIDTAAVSLVRLTNDTNVLAAIDSVADSFIEWRMLGGGDLAVCQLTLRTLSALLGKAGSLKLALFDPQEQLMIDVAISALKLGNNREIMNFAVALKGHIRPEERLEALLEGKADGNLLMYYLSRQ